MPRFLQRDSGRAAAFRDAQRGFVLLELMIAGLLMTMLAVWAGQSWIHRLRETQAQALAAWMLAAREVAHDYLLRHGAEIAGADHGSALEPRGYRDWAQPVWAELKADGVSRSGFPEAGVLGARLGLRILRHGDCPGEGCRLEAVVHTTQAVLTSDGQRVDEGMIALWLMATQGAGAVVWPRSPDVLTGSTLRHPNPLSGLGQPWPPGVVALATSTAGGGGGPPGETQEMDDFLRVGDPRNPDFRGSATVQGDIETGSALRAQQYLVLRDRNQEFQACADEGALSIEAFRSGMLLCRGNIWRSAGRAAGGGFSFNSLHGCVNRDGITMRNPVTGGCSCDAGYVPVQISDSGAHPQDGRTMGYLCVGY